jgi:uncharacterized iron-regulated membrane protein
MNFRTFLFWTHLVVGIAAGLIILMMSLTGVVLTYESQINRWDQQEYRSQAHATHSEPLTVDELLLNITEHAPDATPSAITFRHDHFEPAIVNVGGGISLFFDRYSGQPLGNSDRPIRRFLRSVMYWHRWFALDGDSRIYGRAVTGAANLVFLFLVVSGVYLWWPKTWSPSLLRQVTWFRTGLKGRARNFNWHNVIGLWMSLPLAIIVFSGSAIGYRWVSDSIYLALGENPPVRTTTITPSEADEANSNEQRHYAPYQSMFDQAQEDAQIWNAITLRLPVDNAKSVLLLVDRGTGRQPSKQYELAFDRDNGDLIERTGYPTYSRARKFRRWLRFAHTGEVYGLLGQTIAGIAASGAVVLVWTGLAMAWRRFRNVQSRQSRPSPRDRLR